MDRRDFLLASAAAATTLALGPNTPCALTPDSKRRLARFAYFSDTHVRTTDRVGEWLRVALRQVQRDQVDFVFHGGDLLNAGRSSPIDLSLQQFDLWKAEADRSGLEFRYTIGNHDVLALVGENAQPSHPLAGKNLMTQRLMNHRRYETFDVKGVRFITLDTAETKADNAYRGFVDDVQLAWLKNTLEATPERMPIVVSSHIPVLAAIWYYDGGADKPLPDWQLVQNGKAVFDLLTTRNVVAVLQGHTHSVEEVRYRGTQYITAGAVSGNWWNGKRFGVHEPGYALVDVFRDRVEWSYRPYGWHPLGTLPSVPK